MTVFKTVEDTLKVKPNFYFSDQRYVLSQPFMHTKGYVNVSLETK
jgi:hypothetical protein